MLQSGQGRRDGRTDGRTDGVKPIYPQQLRCSGGIITITMTYNLNHWILLPNLWKKGFQIITVSSWQPLSTVVVLTTIWYLLISAYSILYTISNRNYVDHFELLNSVNFAFSNLVSYGQKTCKYNTDLKVLKNLKDLWNGSFSDCFWSDVKSEHFRIIDSVNGLVRKTMLHISSINALEHISFHFHFHGNALVISSKNLFENCSDYFSGDQ